MLIADQLALAVFDQMPDATIVVDRCGVIAVANARVAQLFGYQPAELVGQRVEVLMPASYRVGHVQRRDEYYRDSHTRPMGLGLDLWAERRDGSAFPVEISLSPIEIQGQELVIAVIRDVSPRLTLEAERQRTTELELLIEERERIAADLHDSVIQQLFATGLSLQALAADREINGVDRVDRAIDQIDGAIREIRTTIFGLASPHSTHDLKEEINEVCSQAARILGFAPVVEIDVGSVDSVPERLQIEVVSTLREALSNVARHARAAHAWVRVTIDRGIEVMVLDDGGGYAGNANGGSGLRNLRSRAERLGGEFTIGPRPGGGTALRWVVPLAAGC